MNGASADEIYDPSAYARVSETREKDKAGRGNKGSVHGCRLTIEDGDISMRYGLLTGHPWMDHEHTVIEIPIQGRIKLEGEWRSNADYLVTVKGRNLDKIFDQINEDKRISMHRSAGVEGDEAHIDSIEIEPLPD